MGTQQNQYDFETFYHAVCADLQNKGEVQSMSKQFSLLGDDNERVKFILEKSFTNSVHWKDFNFSPKDRSESQKLRNLGNQVYQKNRLSEALEYYSQSICLAPHPLPPNTYLSHPQDQEETFSYEELALGYANRSAVLFQMKEYELCIRDITRAFNYSYPNNLMYKLFERKSRCQRAMKVKMSIEFLIDIQLLNSGLRQSFGVHERGRDVDEILDSE